MFVGCGGVLRAYRPDQFGGDRAADFMAVAVLAARRDGASINAASKASGINYRTAQRIVEAAGERRQRQLLAVG